MQIPRVKIFIPIHNPPRSFYGLINTLLEQEAAEVYIHIVNSGNSLSDSGLENKFITIENISVNEFNHGKTRNMALKNIERFDVIVFMTQDVEIFDKTSIIKLVTPIILGNAEASYGRQIANKYISYIDYLDRMTNYGEKSIVKKISSKSSLGMKTYFFSNAFSAVSTNDFISLNGFSSDTIMNEDMLFAYDLINNGGRIAYVSDAVVYHTHNYSLKQIGERYFDHGVFFSINKMKFKDLSPSGGGFSTINKQFYQIVDDKKFTIIPKWLMFALTRLLFYKIGTLYKIIPAKILSHLSMHKRYWGSK